MEDSYITHPQIWTGLATFRGAIYRFELVSNERLWDSEVKNVMAKAGGHVKKLDRPRQTDPLENLLVMMREIGAKYDVTFTPDRLLTNGYMNRKPVNIRLKSNLSKIHDGELQTFPKWFLNPSRPQPQPRPLKRTFRR